MLKNRVVLAVWAVIAISAVAQARDPEKDDAWARMWASGKQMQRAREDTTCSGDRCVHALSWEANNIISGARETTVMRETMIGGTFTTRENCNIERTREATCVDNDDDTTRTYMIAEDGWRLLMRPARTQETDRQNDENWKLRWNAGRRKGAREYMNCLGEWCWNTLSFFSGNADGSASMTILRETLDGSLLVRRESCSRQIDLPAEWDVTCVDIDHGVGECRYKIVAQDDWRLIGTGTVADGQSQGEALAACANGVAQMQ
jgi:hypothetical protein